MNITLIKQEIEKLSTLLTSWEEGKAVSAIECDLALAKLTKLYELIRFEAEPEAHTNIVPPIVAQIDNEPENTTSEDETFEEEQAEQEVEVEIIFADEDEEEEEIITLEDSDDKEVKNEDSAAEKAAEEVVFIANQEPESEPEPGPEPEPEPEPEFESVPEPEKPSKSTQKPTMESLFGTEEIQRKPRSKHQRMMAIYGEAQPKQEKAVDISKIFDMDNDDIFEITTSANTPKEENASKKTISIVNEEVTTLADAIAPQQTTLADTIVAPAALAEEITNSRINSLRQAIGINDKFLMIRDLFDGDDEAYDEAITALDKLPSLEDCMIHIIENYEWNPDVEGSKFIMQLLERKFS